MRVILGRDPRVVCAVVRRPTGRCSAADLYAMADDTDLTEEEMMMRIMNGEDGEGGPDDLSARM